eukprot:m.77648 g.77648  ORF g.77648 m.77648 type:complete len:86 (-) comp14554_c0_seq2:518-775(-)
MPKNNLHKFECGALNIRELAERCHGCNQAARKHCQDRHRDRRGGSHCLGVGVCECCSVFVTVGVLPLAVTDGGFFCWWFLMMPFR